MWSAEYNFAAPYIVGAVTHADLFRAPGHKPELNVSMNVNCSTLVYVLQ